MTDAAAPVPNQSFRFMPLSPTRSQTLTAWPRRWTLEGNRARRGGSGALITIRGGTAHETCAPFARGCDRRDRIGARHRIRDARAGSELQDGRAVHVAQPGDELR